MSGQMNAASQFRSLLLVMLPGLTICSVTNEREGFPGRPTARV